VLSWYLFTSAQDSLNINIVSSLYNFWGFPPQAVKVIGDYAYYASCWDGLIILDISNPFAPSFEGRFQTKGWTSCIDIQGDLAFAACYSNPPENNGLEIIDISDPSAPSRILFYQIGTGVNEVDVEGNLAYITTMDGNFEVIDISNPTNPVLRDIYGFPGYSNGVFVLSNYCYFTSLPGGLRIMNILNPDSIYQTGICNTSHPPGRLFVEGSYSYINEGSYGVEVMNITNPTRPFIVNIYNTPGNSCDCLKNRSYLFVADDSGVRILNVENVNNIFEVGSFIPNYGGMVNIVYGIALQDEYLYTAGNAYGPLGGSFTNILDVSNPAQPLNLGSYYDPGSLSYIELKDNYALVIDYNSCLRVVDINNVLNPFEVMLWDSIPEYHYIKIYDDYAYLGTNSDGMYILNIENPENIYIAGHREDLLGIYYEINEDYLFRFCDGYLRIYNLALNPINPILVGTYYTINNGSPHSIAFNGDIAYILTNYRLEIIDFSVLPTPVLLGAYDLTGGYVKYYQDYLYITGIYAPNWDWGIGIFNVIDPTNPFYTDSLIRTTCEPVEVISADHLIVRDGMGLWFYSLQNTLSPTLTGYYLNTCAYSEILRDSLLYVADDYRFSIFDCASALYISPAPTITISYSEADVYLSWNFLPNAINYKIYRGENPYSTLSEMTLIDTVVDTTYIDENAGISPKFYRVTASTAN
jgi:hypothetical protein